MSSKPFNKQCFLKGSTSKVKTSPSDEAIVCFSKSTSMIEFAIFILYLIFILLTEGSAVGAALENYGV